MCTVYPRRDKARAGRGRRPRSGGGDAGFRLASPGIGCPPPGNAEPSLRTGGAGAGRRPGGSRPGGGAGRAGRGGAVLCKCRPRAANCWRSPRGSERPVPPAAARPEQKANEPRRSKEPQAQRRARARLEEPCSPARPPDPSPAARRAQRPEAERAPPPAPRAGECALGAPARGRPQPAPGEAAPSAPDPSHGPGWGPGPRLLTCPKPAEPVKAAAPVWICAQAQRQEGAGRAMAPGGR